MTNSKHFGIVLLIALIIRGIVASTGFVYDDAYITLRVAKNIAEHGEFTFNLGEYVQTATSNLYALLLGITYKFAGYHSLDIWRW
jgi:hypothetical protein